MKTSDDKLSSWYDLFDGTFLASIRCLYFFDLPRIENEDAAKDVCDREA